MLLNYSKTELFFFNFRKVCDSGAHPVPYPIGAGGKAAGT